MNDEEYRQLVKKYLDEENWFEAWRYSTRIFKKNADDYFYMAVACNGLKNVPMALWYLGKAKDLGDRYLRLYEEALKEVRRTEKLAILCLPGLDNFLKDIYDVFKNIFETKLVVSNNGNELKQAYDWADIVWLEWGNELAVFVTNNFEKKGKKMVMRIHGYEAYLPVLKQINWAKIDHVFFVADHIRDKAIQNCSSLGLINSSIVYNGINLNKYKYSVRQPGKKIAFAGLFNYKKNPQLVVQIIKKLVDIAPDYKFYWVGKIQDERLFDYILYILEEMHLESCFIFESWTNDINSWLEDKSFFLSLSFLEGYGVAIMEAMAKGIKPVVHNFYIAKNYYPRDILYNHIDEAVEMILSPKYESENYREFIEKRGSLENQILGFYQKILSLIVDS